MFLEGLKKDGSSFPIEISLSTYESEGERHVIAFIIDVTERKLQDEKMHRKTKVQKTRPPGCFRTASLCSFASA